jgi:hypothetical protein
MLRTEQILGLYHTGQANIFGMIASLRVNGHQFRIRLPIQNPNWEISAACSMESAPQIQGITGRGLNPEIGLHYFCGAG